MSFPEFSSRDERLNIDESIEQGDALGIARVPIGLSEAYVRSVFLRDEGASSRRVWVGHWLQVCDSRAYEEHSVGIISHVRVPFDAVILDGQDDVALAQILLHWRGLIASKLIVVVMSQSSPFTLAHLLHAGADAVLDIGMEPAVAASLLRAMLRRQALARPTARSGRMLRLSRSDLRLTDREAAILELLAGSSGKVVSYEHILRRLGKSRTISSVRGLHVCMTGLRRKLAENIEISCEPGFGYALQDRSI